MKLVDADALKGAAYSNKNRKLIEAVFKRKRLTVDDIDRVGGIAELL